ncbi:uncharacterized protein LOC115996526 [Ipomoea triloba]|uniref:uncharacterized protein LOC115996526 n=1 Tax=Ipomoea triloba TaxID=35885 RepID=UPI00125DA18E|nr:uncharacterized protein LOC115996526 [Ipomoea triloba]XP_031091645.1 uncharacterized protein LOC115996526 [Ipomoea triloba]XP_031091647.1 uncharacterized protein LOC115996526 [Ipomoea triloba]XP_031091648.1 uncharacterized protein LOC115996526 [Ipomoea triloba]XP_031091649.1 uncharacterized protein LOC115996526 [Ipomoea triloba]
MVKIYGMTNPNEQGFFLIVSEPIKHDMRTYFSLANRAILALNDESRFLRPFRSLLDRINALLHINDDFVLRPIDVLMIETSGGSFEFKIGFISPNPQIGPNLSSMEYASQIVRGWINIPTNRLSNDMKLLLAVMGNYNPACKYNLKMLCRSPVFYVNKKEALIDFVIKLHRVMINQSSSINTAVHKKLVQAFQIMNIRNIFSTSCKWYSIGHASAEIRDCINAKPSSVVNRVTHMVRGIRNIVVHIFPHAKDCLDYAVVYDGIEQMSPGCWAALHFAALEILPHEFTED